MERWFGKWSAHVEISLMNGIKATIKEPPYKRMCPFIGHSTFLLVDVAVKSHLKCREYTSPENGNCECLHAGLTSFQNSENSPVLHKWPSLQDSVITATKTKTYCSNDSPLLHCSICLLNPIHPPGSRSQDYRHWVAWTQISPLFLASW